VFLSGINGSKRVTRTWEMTKEVVIKNLTEPMKMLKKCRILMHSDRCLSINEDYYVGILKWLHETVARDPSKSLKSIYICLYLFFHNSITE